MMFSYGSGAASTLFLLKTYQNVDFMRIRMNIKENLQNRIKISPAEFTDIGKIILFWKLMKNKNQNQKH